MSSGAAANNNTTSSSNNGHQPATNTTTTSPELQRIIDLINASQKDPDDSSAHEEAFQSSLRYLSSLPAGSHLVADNGCDLLVRQSLKLFAFPSSSALDWLKSTLDNHLKNCFICVKQLHRQRTLLHKTMLDTYDRETVTEFFEMLVDWDSSRVLDVLIKAAEYCTSTEKPQASEIPQSFNAMYECFCCPQLLDRPQVRSAFRKVFFGLQTRGKFLHLSTEIVPGIFMFLFSPHQDEREWAYRTFRQHKGDLQEFDVMLVDAFEHVMLQTYQKQSDQAYMLIFWRGIEILLSKASKNVIVKRLRGEQTDIIRFLSMHLQSYPTTTLPILLECFSILLKKLGPDFWDCVSPYIPQNFTDTIFGNPYFKTLVQQHQQQQQEENDDKNNLFEWITPFIDSLSGPALQKSCNAILKALLSTLQSASIPRPISAACAKRGFQLIKQLLSHQLDSTNSSSLLDTNDAVNRIVRRERRELPQPYLNLIFRYAYQEQQDQDITSLARDIIQLCIQLDCLLTIQDNLAGLIKNKQLSSLPIFYGSFWDTLQKQIPAQDVDSAKRIIPSLSNAALGEQVPIKPDMKDKQQRKELNAILFEFFHSVAAILLKFGNTASQDKLNEMLKDGNVVESILMCLFSSNASIYQASVDLIKQAFDTEGRMESLQTLFTLDFNGSLNHFTKAINRCSAPGRFGPGPRMIRACMDLNEILFDSRDGLLVANRPRATTTTDNHKRQNLLLKFWSSVWSMLGTLYKQTMIWADQYPKDSMIDFMRDVLDFSNSLTANYAQLEQFLTTTSTTSTDLSPAGKSQMGRQLLESIILPLSSMSQWLRLSDSALLDSCVQLICQILNLLYISAGASHSLPDDTLELLYKLAYKTKKHHNNLSESQCDKLIIALNRFDYYQFDAPESAAAAAANKQAKLDKWLSNNNKNKSSSSSDDVIEIIDDEATLKSILAASKRSSLADQQAKITAFTKKLPFGTKPSSSSLKLPPPPPKKPLPPVSSGGTGGKPSLISSMRAELAEKRRVIPQSSAAPIQQRTGSPAAAGLRSTIQDNNNNNNNNNIKRKTGINGQAAQNNSDSSSSSDDDDDMDGLFSVSKHNRIRSRQPVQIPKPIPVTPIGTGVSRRGNAIRESQQLSGRELAEQRMRSRLNIDMNPFYKQILKWNYHNDKSFPSGMDQDKYKQVANTFSSVPNYQETFEPLLMLECWQAILQSKTEQGNKPFKLAIGSRAAVDDFIDIYAFASNQAIQDIKIADTDLVVISYIEKPSSSNPVMPAPNHICCLAKINQVKRANPEFTDFTLRTFNPVGMLSHLAPKVELHCLKVINLTTIVREYQALRALPFYELCDNILKAKPAPSIRSDDSVVKRLQANYGVNEPQARAIASALGNDGFTLIQGPPGTGKTKTILGIAAAFLQSNKTRGAPIAIPGRSNPSNNRNAAATQQQQQQQQKRILVCAPSNAAVDELVIRLKSGINSISGAATFAPKVVRLGRSEIINPQVRDLTLEELVDKYLTEYEEKQKDKLDSQSDIRKQHQQVVKERDQIRSKLQGPEISKLSSEEIAKLETKLYELIRLRNDLGRQLDEQRDRAKTLLRNRDIERKNVQSKILNEAQVICSTLSGSAHEVLASLSLTFETIIIDEAAQCIELSALIPLKFGCTRCIMVGDPNQLPPTVLSQAAASFKYEQSLFVRMQTNYPNSVHLLSIQYRMHPDISYFPSKQFYQGKLIDGPGMAELTARQWHEKPQYGPYIIFDIRGIEETSQRTKSIFNRIEAEQILELYDGLIRTYSIIDFDGKIGIVTPYKQQLLHIKSVFRRRYGDIIFQSVDFNTVDGFQGQEKEIVIFSTVRSSGGTNNNNSTIGFLSDVRRMNVGLTRAKCSMWIVGDCKVLQSNNIWNNLVIDAHQRKKVLSSKPGFLANSGNTRQQPQPNRSISAQPQSYPPQRNHENNNNNNNNSNNNKNKNKNNNKDFSRGGNNSRKKGSKQQQQQQSASNSNTNLPDLVPGDTLQSPAELSQRRPRAPIQRPSASNNNNNNKQRGARYFDFHLEGDVEKVLPPKPVPKSKPAPAPAPSSSPLPPPPLPPPQQQSHSSSPPPQSSKRSPPGDAGSTGTKTQRAPPPPPRKRVKGDDVFIRPRRPMPHHSVPPRR